MSSAKELLESLCSIVLNRSLFWKVGFLVGLITLINLGLLFYLHQSIVKKLSQSPVVLEISAEFEEAFFLTLILSACLLLAGAVAFWFMVKKPLNTIINALNVLIYSPDRINDETLKSFKCKDEIGILADTVNQLLANFKNISIYRHLIENDESVEDIYERLANVLKNLGFSSFVIYEVSNSQNTMRVVQKSDEDLDVNSEKLFNADRCRAKRIGKIITSFEDPHVCKLYEYRGVTHHYCIPMLSGNKVLSVVEIHLPLTDKTIRDKNFKERINLCRTFIEETSSVVESKRYAEALREQTYKDPLTNLYNRRFLEGVIDNLTAQIIRRGTLLGVLMCDLDYFKSINDRYGHEVGDFVLRETAQLLANNVRKADLVVRFGGEEFLILLLDIREGEAEKVAEKLRKAIEVFDFKTPKGILKRTISIGVSEFPADSSAIWEAIKFADVALYKAKEGGRNKVVRFKREFWTAEEY